MKTLYIDSPSGISGNMMIGALLDLGASYDALAEGLASLGVSGYSLHCERVEKRGISAMYFNTVLSEEESDPHDPPHPHHHPHTRGDDPCDHVHEGHGEHGNHAAHTHGEHGCHAHPSHAHGDHAHHGDHDHAHRNLGDVRAIIEASPLSDRVKRRAMEIFLPVAEAEAKIHGRPVEEVHFHEVGAIDSIVDIVGVSILLEELGIERILTGPLSIGTGYVRCAHGKFPVPAPATLEILARGGIPVTMTGIPSELVTPTGAAIVAALAEPARLRDARICRIGYGAGTKDLEIPNVLRLLLLAAEDGSEESVVKLEANLDDMTGEDLGFAMGEIQNAGALDVTFSPLQMKKNRPGVLLTALARPEDLGRVEAAIFRHTTTIGLRKVRMERTVLPRREVRRMTALGEVRVKLSGEGETQREKIEHDDLARAALTHFPTAEEAKR